jgi:hypothetical protein
MLADNDGFCSSCGRPCPTEQNLLYQHRYHIIAIVCIAFVIIGYFASEHRKMQNIIEERERHQMNQILSEARNTPSRHNLTIERGWTWERQRNHIYIEGFVKNNGSINIRYFKIHIDYLDASGNVIDSGFTNGSDVAPNTSKRFNTMHRWDDRIVDVRLRIDEVR